ncbi:MAG TPA: ATP synthase F1 subunit gamma [Candidatus Limiplasma sp.]|nr:ATP synthase F1 subunit gamma [Candidatus Limiplasma sp.]
MSSIPEIRHHIKAISETAKITRAMHLIASAKMKKAMQAHEQTMQYYSLVRSNMRFILDNAPDDFRSDFYRANGQRTCFLVIAGDKGMCGGYNHDVLKFAQQEVQNPRHRITRLITFGHMATDYFRRKGLHIDQSYLTAVQNPTLDQARELAAELCRSYKRDEFDEVFIIFTQMMKGGITKPMRISVLPITKHTVKNVPPMHNPTSGLQFWPNAQGVLDSMAQHYVVGVLYSCLVQSFASENRARMTAMESATRNADDMLKKLQLQLNHARQAAITQEINEIIGGNPDSFKL